MVFKEPPAKPVSELVGKTMKWRDVDFKIVSVSDNNHWATGACGNKHRVRDLSEVSVDELVGDFEEEEEEAQAPKRWTGKVPLIASTSSSTSLRRVSDSYATIGKVVISSSMTKDEFSDLTRQVNGLLSTKKDGLGITSYALNKPVASDEPFDFDDSPPSVTAKLYGVQRRPDEQLRATSSKKSAKPPPIGWADRDCMLLMTNGDFDDYAEDMELSDCALAVQCKFEDDPESPTKKRARDEQERSPFKPQQTYAIQVLWLHRQSCFRVPVRAPFLVVKYAKPGFYSASGTQVCDHATVLICLGFFPRNLAFSSNFMRALFGCTFSQVYHGINEPKSEHKGGSFVIREYAGSAIRSPVDSIESLRKVIRQNCMERGIQLKDAIPQIYLMKPLANGKGVTTKIGLTVTSGGLFTVVGSSIRAASVNTSAWCVMRRLRTWR